MSVIVFTLSGPVSSRELPDLRHRIEALLEGNDASEMVCHVAAVEPSAVTVDALAQVQLLAQRRGCCVRVTGASEELRELIAFMGLGDVVKTS
jgi:ABC-type transporter Mla MlaB component